MRRPSARRWGAKVRWTRFDDLVDDATWTQIRSHCLPGCHAAQSSANLAANSNATANRAGEQSRARPASVLMTT